MLPGCNKAATESSAVGTMFTPSIVPITPIDPAPTHKPVILLVEDESIVREVTREVLEHAGYQVLESDGPAEAMRLAEAHQGSIALLLSDVVMPGMNGIDLARWIQELQPRLATVFMSGYENHAVLNQTVQDPLGTYIQKPFTIDVLLACIAEALGRNSTSSKGAGLSDFSA
jgi:two-component system, cell cycle sensor histidine kinase and response regulator CckA